MDAVVEERWREERRGRILKAAGRIFADRPYAAASMDDIAAQAGIGKPTLYRYFRSKNALFAAVFVQALDELEGRLDAVRARRLSVRDEVQGLLAAICPTVRNHLVPLSGRGDGDAAADQSRRLIFRDRRVRIGRFLSDAIERGVRSGELAVGVPGDVAQMMLGMVRSAAANTAMSDTDIAREVTGIVLRGLAAGPDVGDGIADVPGHPVGTSEMKARLIA